MGEKRVKKLLKQYGMKKDARKSLIDAVDNHPTYDIDDLEENAESAADWAEFMHDLSIDSRIDGPVGYDDDEEKANKKLKKLNMEKEARKALIERVKRSIGFDLEDLIDRAKGLIDFNEFVEEVMGEVSKQKSQLQQKQFVDAVKTEVQKQLATDKEKSKTADRASTLDVVRTGIKVGLAPLIPIF